MSDSIKIGVVVHCPSPHQKVWLDELYAIPGADPVVAYAYPNSPNRTWGMHRANGKTVQVPPVHWISGDKNLRQWVIDLNRDVWVLGSAFTYPRTQALATTFTAIGIPWAYAGEPPRPRTGVRRAVRDWMLRRVLTNCKGVIATGVEPARRYRELLGDGRPVTSVPYYIPLDEWRSLPLVTPPARGETFRFLTLAQLIPRKGLDLLVEACSILPRSGWRLDVYGDGPERNRLQRAVQSRNLPITLHHPLPFDRRVEAFRGAHCFVFPSRWDGWGMAPVEALAAGLPVIASTNTMSAYDFLQDNVNGWFVPCDSRAIAEAMQAAISQPSRLPMLSQAARAAVRGYDPHAGARELIRFCRALVEAERSRPSAA